MRFRMLTCESWHVKLSFATFFLGGKGLCYLAITKIRSVGVGVKGLGADFPALKHGAGVLPGDPHGVLNLGEFGEGAWCVFICDQ